MGEGTGGWEREEVWNDVKCEEQDMSRGLQAAV